MRSGPWILVIGFCLLGGVHVLVHLDLPIVRNSVVYAHIAYALIDAGRDFSVQEHALNKAVGFPVLSSPFVALFGANAGLKLSSWLWTSLWAASCVVFFRRLARVLRWDDRPEPDPRLLLAVLLVNPLVVYQFVSAYPDTLNALAFLWVLYFLDRMLSVDARSFDGPLFAATTLLAIWIKHHGFVILPIALVFALCRIDVLAQLGRRRRGALAASILAAAALLGLLALAQAGRLPGFNLSPNPSNYDQAFGDLSGVVRTNLRLLRDYLLLSFGVLVPLLLRWRGISRYKEWYLSIAVFVATILVYGGSAENIRYFLPLAPLLSWIICSNLAALPRRIATPLVGGFLVLNLLLALAYNSVLVRKKLDEISPAPGYFDNLRLVHEQEWTRTDLATLNASARPDRNTLFLVREYQAGVWSVWQRDGVLSRDFHIVHSSELDWSAIEEYARRHDLHAALLYVRSPVEQAQRANRPAGIRSRALLRDVHELAFGSAAPAAER